MTKFVATLWRQLDVRHSLAQALAADRSPLLIRQRSHGEAPIGSGRSHQGSVLAWVLLIGSASCPSCSGPTTPSPTPASPALAVGCPLDLQQSSATGGSMVVIYQAPAVAGGVAPVTVICDPTSGATFPIGSTPVNCAARDAASQVATCTFRVTLSAPPRISVTRFLAFGDSLTEGKFGLLGGPALTFPAAYTLRLQEMLAERYTTQSLMVVNAGVGGEPTSVGVTRLPIELRTWAPAGLDVVLVWDGANDIGGGLPAIAPAVQNLRAMIQIARTSGLRVLLANLPPRRPGGSRAGDAAIVPVFNEAVRALATSENVPLIDIYTAFEGDLSLIGADGLHLTDEGYRRVAQAAFEVVCRTFEISSASGVH